MFFFIVVSEFIKPKEKKVTLSFLLPVAIKVQINTGHSRVSSDGKEWGQVRGQPCCKVTCCFLMVTVKPESTGEAAVTEDQSWEDCCEPCGQVICATQV